MNRLPVWRLLIAFCLAVLSLYATLSPIRADDPTPQPGLQPTLQATSVPTPSPFNFTLTGNLISGTAGVGIPAALPVTLNVIRAGAPGTSALKIDKYSTLLGAANKFRFEPISVLPGDSVFVTATVERILQGSPIIPLDGKQQSIDLVVTVYAGTNNPDTVTLVKVQHILDFKGKFMRVLASYFYRNTGDRFYLSSDKATNGKFLSVAVPLPIAASGIAFGAESASSLTVGGSDIAPVVQDTDPVLPGTDHEVVFSYQVPYDKGAPIDQDYPFQTTSVEVLIPNDVGVKLTGDFDAMPNITLNAQRPYTQYTLRKPIPAGGRLVYNLDGVIGGAPATLAVKPIPAAEQTGLPIPACLVLMGVLAVIVGLIFAFRRTPATAAKASVTNKSAGPKQR